MSRIPVSGFGLSPHSARCSIERIIFFNSCFAFTDSERGHTIPPSVYFFVSPSKAHTPLQYILVPVSYTHLYFFQAVLHSLTVLDYRHDHHCSRLYRGPSESEGLPGKNRVFLQAFDDPDPVSYTHLDVYKRQVLVYTVRQKVLGFSLCRRL